MVGRRICYGGGPIVCASVRALVGGMPRARAQCEARAFVVFRVAMFWQQPSFCRIPSPAPLASASRRASQ
eukprot:5368920-Lingulodinium_polyedra.AAC.1